MGGVGIDAAMFLARHDDCRASASRRRSNWI